MTTMSRQFYIPKDAIKVSDKLSDAVAYIYASGNSYGMAMFYGKQSKPVYRYRFMSAAGREQFVKERFAERQAKAARDAARRQERKDAGVGLVAGDIVSTCWGYEQTNREFFEVTEVRGKHVILRELMQATEARGQMRGVCVPQAGEYKGEPIRRLARDGRVKIDDVRSASKWNTGIVAGVAVGPALEWTAYG